jgi:hypothetical protein
LELLLDQYNAHDEIAKPQPPNDEKTTKRTTIDFPHTRIAIHKSRVQLFLP